jgi:hypothetical protein
VSISSYSELKTAIQNWTKRSSLADARLVEFINLAESRIAKELRVRDMETIASVSVVAGTRTAALPTNYRGLKRVTIDTDPVTNLRFVSPDFYWSTWNGSGSGEPEVYTIEAGNFVFGPVPVAARTASVLSMGLAALTGSVTPALFTNNPELYLYAALVESAPYLGNADRLPEWEGKYQVALQTVKESNKKDRHPGPLIRRRIGGVA